ncbi:hypothetical protein PGB90_002215 [Kerria lacca]
MENDNKSVTTFVELQTIKETVHLEDVKNQLSESIEPIFASNEGCDESEKNDKEICENDSDIKNDFSECGSCKPPKNKMPVKKFKIKVKMNKIKKKSKTLYNKKGRNKLKKKRKLLYSKGSKSKTVTSAVNRRLKCEYPRLCTGCGHAYKTKQSFWNHKQRCPMLPQNSMRNNVDENGFLIDGDGNGDFVRRKEYICAHCEKHYRKKYNLQEHLKNTCRGKPCSKGRLQCWEEGCTQAFYKYVDLVQHATLQHGQDLKIQKLQFPNLSAFNSWKTEESNSKFMYARKITGSKQFSNTKYHYFVCQFNHRNEKKNNNRKTSRRKNDSLVVPNYNCPSRIMVKEWENQVLVTYISSHNHELNLSNVKYQPLEKEARAYIKTLLQLGVSAKKIIEHLQEGVGNPEIDSFLTTKQHFLTLSRIKRMESKLKAKNRALQKELIKDEKDITLGNNLMNVDNNSMAHDDSFSPCENIMDPVGTCSTSYSCTPSQKPLTIRKEPDEKMKTIGNNLKKLKGYINKNSIKEKLSDRISKLIQELCDECENVQSTSGVERPVPQKKPRGQNTSRKRKAASTVIPPTMPIQIQQPSMQPVILQPHPIPMQPQPQMQQLQSMEIIDQNRIVNSVVNSVVNNGTVVSNIIIRNDTVMRNDKTFTPVINETTDLLKAHFQPFNVNLLCLKSIDRFISEREQLILKRVDERFTVGWLCDSIVNSFLNLICQPFGNVIAADTSITEFVQMNQKVPDVWHCFNWNDIDTIFIPCNPSKKHWFLLVLLVKQAELQILDTANSYDSISNIYKKYANSINCWYNVLRNFLGVVQCNVTSPVHATHTDPSNSGVLVCWYVFQYINRRNLSDGIDPDVFRQYMYNTIINNSSPV